MKERRAREASGPHQREIGCKVCRMTLHTQMEVSLPSKGSDLAPLCHSNYMNRARSQIRTKFDKFGTGNALEDHFSPSESCREGASRACGPRLCSNLSSRRFGRSLCKVQRRGSCSKYRELLTESRRLNASIKIRALSLCG